VSAARTERVERAERRLCAACGLTPLAHDNENAACGPCTRRLLKREYQLGQEYRRMRRWLLAEGEDPEGAGASQGARLCLERFVLSAVARLAWPWTADGRAPIPGATYAADPEDLAATTGMSAFAAGRSLRALAARGKLRAAGRTTPTGPARWELLDWDFDGAPRRREVDPREVA
jgi:ribosomal protein S27AE